MRSYVGLIHKDAASDFGVSFPDFPGVATAGTTLEEARAMAEEALALHVEGMLEDGEAIPTPSGLDAIMNDPGNRDGVAVLINLKLRPVRALRVNVTLPEDILAAIDAYANSHGYTRSGFLASAARKALEDAVD